MSEPDDRAWFVEFKDCGCSLDTRKITADPVPMKDGEWLPWAIVFHGPITMTCPHGNQEVFPPPPAIQVRVAHDPRPIESPEEQQARAKREIEENLQQRKN